MNISKLKSGTNLRSPKLGYVCKGEMFRTPCQAQVKQLAQVQALFLGGTCVTIQLKAYCPWSQNVKGSWHQSNMAHAVA